MCDLSVAWLSVSAGSRSVSAALHGKSRDLQNKDCRRPCLDRSQPACAGNARGAIGDYERKQNCMNEFYVGYLPKAPAGISRRIRAVVIALMAIAAVGAITFASVQRTFAPAIFEYGKQRSFKGIIERRPFPTLLVKRPGRPDSGSSHYLLVAEGKYGADDEVAAFEGKPVRLKGTLIYRGNETMIEVVTGSISMEAAAEALPPAEKMLRAFELSGEIVDGKCY